MNEQIFKRGLSNYDSHPLEDTPPLSIFEGLFYYLNLPHPFLDS